MIDGFDLIIATGILIGIVSIILSLSIGSNALAVCFLLGIASMLYAWSMAPPAPGEGRGPTTAE